jgi:hypothetical protein
MPLDVARLAWLPPDAVNVPEPAVTPPVNAAELPVTPPANICTSGNVLAVFVDAIPPTTFCGGSSTPPPNVPGVTPAAPTLTLPLTFPYNVPTNAGATIWPAATTMPLDVARLAWLLPLAVNVPDAAVMPLVHVPELPTSPPANVCTSANALAVFVDAIPPTTFWGGSSTPPPNVPEVTPEAPTLAALP